MGKIYFSNVLTQNTQDIIFSIYNQYFKIIEIFFLHFFPFILRLQNSVCILHLQHISIQTGHVSVDQ